MRSWMSIAALTAVTAEPNSASMASPAVPTRRPLAAWMAGRQTSICAVFRCRKVRVSDALHHAGEARDVGVDDGG